MIIANIDTQKIDQEKLYEQREDLLYEKRISSGYDISDFVLVRATDYPPIDNTIMPIDKIPLLVKNNHLIKRVILKLLNEEKHLDFFQDEEEYLKRLDIIKQQFLPYSSQYRSTVHYSVNGLVSSHMMGDFTNRNFIIIDSLEYHLQNNNIRSFRIEDTFEKGESKLSNKAVLLIEESRYPRMLAKYPFLKDANIVLFSGDENLAVEAYLTNNNIITEKITEHGSKEHRCSDKLHLFANRLRNTFHIGAEPHNLTEDYKEDDEKSLKIWDYYNKKFYDFFLTKLNISEEEKQSKMEMLMNSYFEEESEKYLTFLISKIGLDAFSQIVDEFNKSIEESIKNGTFKTNYEIISQIEKNELGSI